MSHITDLCRICLADDMLLDTVSDTPLQTVFERVTNTQLHTADSRPTAVCYICHAQLKRSLGLMHTSAKSEKMLTRMLQHPQGSNTSNKTYMLDHNSNSLCRSLGITPVDCIDTFSFNEPIAVKEEPEYGLDNVKQEKQFEESLDPSAADLTPDQYNDKCEVDLKDDDVLRSIRLEQECYGYKLKAEPFEEGSSWQGFVESSGCTEDIQAKDNDLLTKQKRKHAKKAKKHKRKHNEKHLKNDDGPSIKPEKHCQTECKSSNEEPKPEKKPKTNTASKYFECALCQYRFNRKCHLETHMIVHKGEKLFQCSYCQKRFNLKQGLDRHLNTHTREKTFQCPVCPKMFVEKGVMTIHIRTHTGEQPYECDICEKRFKQRNDMKRHRRTHTGEKPFKCDICQRRFNERSKVTRHQKRHYGEKLTKRDLKKLFM